MPDTAEYHRSFVLYQTPTGRFGLYPVKGIAYVPEENYKKEHERNNSVVAYQLLESGMKQVRIAKKPDQNFARYATAWERHYSPLAGGRARTEPVVNQNLEVVGHIGWFGPSDIYVSRGTGALDLDGNGTIDKLRSINETIEQYGSVRIALTQPIGRNVVQSINPDPRAYVEYDADLLPRGSRESFQLLTDKDGSVKLQLDSRIFDGLAPPAIDPFVLLGVGQLVYSVGKGMASMVIRRIGARTAATDAAGGATGRTTSRGMGAVGPGSEARGAADNLVPRLGPGGRLEYTVDQMGNYLAPLFKSNPEFVRLMAARTLRGDALKREVQDILKAWERRTGKQVEIVPQGTVQAMTNTPGNFASMQGRKLMIERQVLENPAKLYEETVHELASAALGGKGVPHIWIVGNERYNAQKILEGWISQTGSFDWFRQLLGATGI